MSPVKEFQPSQHKIPNVTKDYKLEFIDKPEIKSESLFDLFPSNDQITRSKLLKEPLQSGVNLTAMIVNHNNPSVFLVSLFREKFGELHSFLKIEDEYGCLSHMEQVEDILEKLGVVIL